MSRLALPAAALLTLAATAAQAHTGAGDTLGLAHGFAHPLGGKALWLVPLSFVGMMAVGFLLGVGQIDVPFVELGIALSSVVIGGVAALGRPMPVVAASALVGVFAIFHGHAHGAEMPVDASGFEYAAGFIVATALLHAAGIGAATGVAKVVGKYGKTVAQVAGGAFALGGVGVLAGWL